MSPLLEASLTAELLLSTGPPVAWVWPATAPTVDDACCVAAAVVLGTVVAVVAAGRAALTAAAVAAVCCGWATEDLAEDESDTDDWASLSGLPVWGPAPMIDDDDNNDAGAPAPPPAPAAAAAALAPKAPDNSSVGR